MTAHIATPPDETQHAGTPPAPGPAKRERTRSRRLLRNPGLLAAVAFVVVLLGWVLLPSLFTSHDPLRGLASQANQAPSWDHLFGTDRLGRDLFARVVHGTSLSLRSAALAVLVGLVAGSSIGLLAGFIGRWVDDIAMRFVDVLLAIPGLLLSLAVVTAIGFGTTNVAIAVGVGSVASFARVIRSEVLRIRSATYVEAAYASGCTRRTVLLRHVAPNVVGPALALATLEFGTACLAVSSLSFLGFGAVPPTPEWGSLVAEGRNALATSWWLATFPGLAVVATVVAANRLARALVADPRGGEQ
ncbi:peptide ABC transporter permease [Acrocarpospora pleiomorpha]|uniref:Peptide ABC transporter permease n=1 Tax=Acrocarpospora pleiomorpha TaxID=90975 RepID=A0A5M3XJZ3_9ACTN|nr:ABC transporter permease [Acrocarpospora pleiomorpha]GES19971.1 peptide ABC transporter permease [Acrocarpospora pleiomorpha]